MDSLDCNLYNLLVIKKILILIRVSCNPEQSMVVDPEWDILGNSEWVR